MRPRNLGGLAAVAAAAAVLISIQAVTGQNQRPAEPGGKPAMPQKELLSYGVGFTEGDRVRQGLKDDAVQVDSGLLTRSCAWCTKKCRIEWSSAC